MFYAASMSRISLAGVVIYVKLILVLEINRYFIYSGHIALKILKPKLLFFFSIFVWQSPLLGVSFNSKLLLFRWGPSRSRSVQWGSFGPNRSPVKYKVLARDPGQIQESAPAYGEQRNANRDYVVVMYVISIHQNVKRKNKHVLKWLVLNLVG